MCDIQHSKISSKSEGLANKLWPRSVFKAFSLEKFFGGQLRELINRIVVQLGFSDVFGEVIDGVQEGHHFCFGIKGFNDIGAIREAHVITCQDKLYNHQDNDGR